MNDDGQTLFYRRSQRLQHLENDSPKIARGLRSITGGFHSSRHFLPIQAFFDYSIFLEYFRNNLRLFQVMMEEPILL